MAKFRQICFTLAVIEKCVNDARLVPVVDHVPVGRLVKRIDKVIRWRRIGGRFSVQVIHVARENRFFDLQKKATDWS